MTLWRSSLFTLGGYNGSRLDEVQEYSLSKNIWKLHSLLPEALEASSAVVLNNNMYNIGGRESSHSVLWHDLCSNAPSEWKAMDLANYDFSGYCYREALVLENKIVYFGSGSKERTFILEQ